MTESMRRAQVIGDSPASRVRAMGLGSPRNGLPPQRAYVHPGWVDGVPSAADNPTSGARRAEAARQGRIRRLAEDGGHCPDCSYPLDSWGHSVVCEDGS